MAWPSPIINGAFRSAGQRCSALRCLYVQSDVADKLLTMLKGAMDALVVGDPWNLSSDIGPVIDSLAHKNIADYIAAAQDRVLHQIPAPKTGTYIPPTIIKVDSIADMTREIFGPVLHVATFEADELDRVAAERTPCDLDQRRKYLRQPQPDWRGRRQPTLWRRRSFRYRPQSRRPALPAALRASIEDPNTTSDT